MAEALGMIETRSFPATVEAADAMVKSRQSRIGNIRKKPVVDSPLSSCGVMLQQSKRLAMPDKLRHLVLVKSWQSMSLHVLIPM